MAEHTMSGVTDGNWGADGNDPLGSAPTNRPRRQATGPGFYSYLQDQINRAGGLQPRRGTTTAFRGGELDGMDMGQAEAHLADKYANLPDDEAQKWEPPVAALPHEIADSAPSGPASQYLGPRVSRAPSAEAGDYGPNPDADLARLRTAGVIGQNETISDPAAFKAAVAKLDAKTSPATASATPSQGTAAPTPPVGSASMVTGASNATAATPPISSTSPVSPAAPVASPMTVMGPPSSLAPRAGSEGRVISPAAIPSQNPSSAGNSNPKIGSDRAAAEDAQADERRYVGDPVSAPEAPNRFGADADAFNTPSSPSSVAEADRLAATPGSGQGAYQGRNATRTGAPMTAPLPPYGQPASTDIASGNWGPSGDNPLGGAKTSPNPVPTTAAAGPVSSAAPAPPASDATQRQQAQALATPIGQSAGGAPSQASSSDYSGPAAVPPLGPNELDPVTGRKRQMAGAT